MPDSHFIQVNNLSVKEKNYYAPGDIELVKNISFNIAEGSMVALIGTPGTGKTVLSEAIGCRKTAGVTGSVSIGGLNIFENANILRESIFFPGNYMLTNALTVLDELKMSAAFFCPNLTRKECRVKIEALIDEYDLTPKSKKRISELSLGEKRRIHLMLALLSERRIYFFDGPDAGLGPISSRELISYIRKATHDSANPKTFIITPQYEANLDLFDQVIVLRKFDGLGRLSFSGTPAAAKEYYGITDYKEIFDKIYQDTSGSHYLI